MNLDHTSLTNYENLCYYKGSFYHCDLKSFTNLPIT